MTDDSPLKLDREEPARQGMSRRGLLAAGAGSAIAADGLGSPGAFAAGLRSSADSVSMGSNASDPVPKAAYAQVFKTKK